MREGDPHGGPKQGKGKKNRTRRAQDGAVPSKHSPAPAARTPAQAPSSHAMHATPPRPAPSRSGRGHGQRDWSATSRAKADAILANTSSQWYAGAAFDRSPAAHTLPHPTKLLATRGTAATALPETDRGDPSAQLMATSCPSSSPGSVAPVRSGGSRTHVASPEQRSQAELRAKSQDLLRMLKGGRGGAAEVGHSKSPVPSPSHGTVGPSHGADGTKGATDGGDVEELTRQVRQLLNLPPPSGRRAR